MSSGPIEVDVNRTPTKAPRVAKRLENSPKTLFPSTPEKRQERQEKAQEKRQNLHNERVAKAHAEVELAKKRAAAPRPPTQENSCPPPEGQ